jgi:hypothetical protein
MLRTLTTVDHRKVSVAGLLVARIVPRRITRPDAPINAKIRERMARVKAARRRRKEGSLDARHRSQRILGRSVGRPAGVSMCVHERMSACTPRVSCSDIPANAKALTASSSARASGRMGATERQKGRRIGHHIRLYSWCGLSGNALGSRAGLDPHFAHAPQHVADTHIWGVSDPAWRLRGRGGGAGAGSLTPHPCCDTVLGRLAGGTMRRPPQPTSSATTPAPPRLCSRAFAGRPT